MHSRCQIAEKRCNNIILGKTVISRRERRDTTIELFKSLVDDESELISLIMVKR